MIDNNRVFYSKKHKITDQNKQISKGDSSTHLSSDPAHPSCNNKIENLMSPPTAIPSSLSRFAHRHNRKTSVLQGSQEVVEYFIIIVHLVACSCQRTDDTMKKAAENNNESALAARVECCSTSHDREYEKDEVAIKNNEYVLVNGFLLPCTTVY